MVVGKLRVGRRMCLPPNLLGMRKMSALQPRIGRHSCAVALSSTSRHVSLTSTVPVSMRRWQLSQHPIKSGRGLLYGGGVHLSTEHLLGEGVPTPQAQVPPPTGGGPDPPTAGATPLGGGPPHHHPPVPRPARTGHRPPLPTPTSRNPPFAIGNASALTTSSPNTSVGLFIFRRTTYYPGLWAAPQRPAYRQAVRPLQSQVGSL